MVTQPGSARASKICMLTYQESPACIPPMFNDGVSLARSGFEVEALCLGSSAAPSPTEVHVPGFTTRRIPIRTRSFFHSLFGVGTAHPAIAAVQYVLSYAEYAVKASVGALSSRADLYEAHDLPPLLPTVLAAKLRRKPVVYHAHELWAERHEKVPFAAFWRLLDRALVPRCDEVVTPDEHRSRIYRDEFRARRTPMTVRNCPPYRPPIDSTVLREEVARRGIRCSTIVLYQGLVDSMRCIEEIVASTRHLDDGLVLVVIGSGFGAWADPVAALAGHERIVVLPRVRYEELARYTASADVGIVLYRNNCRNNYLCAPNKVFEYMMMGLPIIAASYPGMLELVQGEEVGLCVNPEDPLEIAAAVNRLATDTALRARMKANALRLSRSRYNWETEFRPLFERYGQLVRGGGRSSASVPGAEGGAGPAPPTEARAAPR